MLLSTCSCIELELDIPTIQRTQQEHKYKLLEQTRVILFELEAEKISKATDLALIKALTRIEKIYLLSEQT